MARRERPRTIGNRIAPPRFILFVVVLIAGIAAGNLLFDWRTGTMAGFDLAALVFLASLTPVIGSSDPRKMRVQAAENDANRVLLLGLTVAVTTVVLVTVAAELAAGDHPMPWIRSLIVGTLVLAWLFSNAVYSLHYAHLYYSRDADGKGDSGGLDFQGDKEPCYWDFIYFAFTLGMTFQTSDTGITSPRLRRVAVIHSFAAFVFNIGILAFTINVLGGSS
jgi:uncharacterized membrane protein